MKLTTTGKQCVQVQAPQNQGSPRFPECLSCRRNSPYSPFFLSFYPHFSFMFPPSFHLLLLLLLCLLFLSFFPPLASISPLFTPFHPLLTPFVTPFSPQFSGTISSFLTLPDSQNSLKKKSAAKLWDFSPFFPPDFENLIQIPPCTTESKHCTFFLLSRFLNLRQQSSARWQKMTPWRRRIQRTRNPRTKVNILYFSVLSLYFLSSLLPYSPPPEVEVVESLTEEEEQEKQKLLDEVSFFPPFF